MNIQVQKPNRPEFTKSDVQNSESFDFANASALERVHFFRAQFKELSREFLAEVQASERAMAGENASELKFHLGGWKLWSEQIAEPENAIVSHDIDQTLILVPVRAWWKSRRKEYWSRWLVLEITEAGMDSHGEASYEG